MVVLNNNKPLEHKGKVLLIDATKNYTAQIAQNIMSEEDVAEVFKLYCGYEDVIDKSKVVTLSEIADNDYSLAVTNYIEHTQLEIADHSTVLREYFDAVELVRTTEEKLKDLLVKEGWLNE